MRGYWRATRRFAALSFAIAGCFSSLLVVRLVARKDLSRSARTLHRWCIRLLRWLQVEVLVQGTPPSEGLLVSNHLSYLDILVFSATVPCVFVAKREVKFWPVIGWITTLARTVYIDRTRKSATHSVQPQLQKALRSSVPVTLFPEGTSSGGGQVHPFHSSLLQVAVEGQTPVTAAAISYELDGGDPDLDVCYYGDMVLAMHVLRLFQKGAVRAFVRFDKHSRIYGDRKVAARELRERVFDLKGQPAAATDCATELV